MQLIKTKFKVSIGSMSISPDGKWLAAHPSWLPTFENDDPPPYFPVSLFEVDELHKKPRIIAVQRPRGVEFLPDGRLIIDEWFRNGLGIWEGPDWEKKLSFLDSADHYGFYTLDQGTQLVIIADSRWQHFDSRTGEPIRIARTAFRNGTDDVTRLAVHPDGTEAIAIAREHLTTMKSSIRVSLCKWSYPKGKLIQSKILKKINPWPPFYSPDGKFILAKDPNELIVWDAETLEEVSRVTPKLSCRRGNFLNHRLHGPKFTPDGSKLFFGSDDGKVHSIFTANWKPDVIYDWGKQFKKEHDVKNGFARINQIEFTRDGTRAIAAMSFDFVVWDLI